MTEREEFEKWYATREQHDSGLITTYNHCWEGWQAARRTVSGQEAKPIAYLSTDPREWDQSRIKRQGNFTVPVYAAPLPATELTLDEISAFAERLSDAGYSKQADSLRRILAAAKRYRDSDIGQAAWLAEEYREKINRYGELQKTIVVLGPDGSFIKNCVIMAREGETLFSFTDRASTTLDGYTIIPNEAFQAMLATASAAAPDALEVPSELFGLSRKYAEGWNDCREAILAAAKEGS